MESRFTQGLLACAIAVLLIAICMNVADAPAAALETKHLSLRVGDAPFEPAFYSSTGWSRFHVAPLAAGLRLPLHRPGELDTRRLGCACISSTWNPLAGTHLRI